MFGRAEREVAGKFVVEFQADAVKRAFPKFVERQDERQAMDEMRRVGKQMGALAQRLAHERDAALLQVTHAAVDELGAAAARGLREIRLLDQRRAITAR